MTELYFAAPLFTQAERAFNATLAARLAAAGYRVFLPQDACEGLTDTAEIFQACLNGLKAADGVLAVLDGADADSGTCWECGYACATGKPVVALRTDFRGTGDRAGFNAMLFHSASRVVSPTDEDPALAAIAALGELWPTGI